MADDKLERVKRAEHRVVLAIIVGLGSGLYFDWAPLAAGSLLLAFPLGIGFAIAKARAEADLSGEPNLFVYLLDADGGDGGDGGGDE